MLSVLVQNRAVFNRPRSIYLYSNIDPRPSGHNCNYFLVPFVFQFPKETWIQREPHQKNSREHVRILTYRTWHTK